MTSNLEDQKEKGDTQKMEKSLGRRQAQMRTQVISNMMTNHSKLVGSINHNERLEVHDIEVEGDTSTVSIELYEEVPNEH